MRGILLQLALALVMSGCASEIVLFERVDGDGMGTDRDATVDASSPQGDGGAPRDGGSGDASMDAGSEVSPDGGVQSRRVALGVGLQHSCAVREGALYCWGDGSDGRTGLLDTDPRVRPTRVSPTRADFVDVCGGEEHSCALTEDSSVWCWGKNLHGELGLSDFKVRLEPTLLPNLKLSRIACGGYNSCGLRSDGALFCWGDNFEGKIGQGDPFDSADIPTPTRVAPTRLFRDVGVGQGHVCAVAREGDLSCWGRNTDGQLGIASDEPQLRRPMPVASTLDFRRVAAGQRHTCAIAVDGRLFCWGTNSVGSLGTNAPDEALETAPVQVGSASDYTEIDVQWFHTCAVRGAGELSCWGRNVEGQLGVGDNSDRSAPARAGMELGFRSVSLGRFHTCALRGNDISCWGSNELGELGLGDMLRRNTPTVLSF